MIHPQTYRFDEAQPHLAKERAKAAAGSLPCSRFVPRSSQRWPCCDELQGLPFLAIHEDLTLSCHSYGFSNQKSTANHPLQGRHAADRYRLRLHRARSVVLTPSELVEIRAAQRTFEGAYVRTALGQFSFALVVLKVFTSEFYSIGALFAVYGAGVLFASLFRRQQGNRQFFSEAGEDGLQQKKFRTSGNVVSVLTALSLAAYVSLLVLVFRLSA